MDLSARFSVELMRRFAVVQVHGRKKVRIRRHIVTPRSDSFHSAENFLGGIGVQIA